MSTILGPILLFVLAAVAVAIALLAVGVLVGPHRNSPVKEMPYESGMDPIHDARRRFDVRFHLVAIVFLLFDVELMFLYPWAVANKDPEGLAAVGGGTPWYRLMVFGELVVFLALLAAGLVYVWKKGLFRWR